jgi:hypothetical protein
MTRPDLAFAYSELSKYVKYPQPDHMLAAQHVLCYKWWAYLLKISPGFDGSLLQKLNKWQQVFEDKKLFISALVHVVESGIGYQ